MRKGGKGVETKQMVEKADMEKKQKTNEEKNKQIRMCNQMAERTGEKNIMGIKKEGK